MIFESVKTKGCKKVQPKTPSFIPGQRWPENLEISIITDVRFSNFNNSELVKGINELLSYSKNLVFWAPYGFGFMSKSQFGFEWQPFEKKLPKSWDSVLSENGQFQTFLSILKKCFTLKGCRIQTTWPTVNLWVSVERKYPYLSFGT